MANNTSLGIYNPIFYASEALIILYKRLGMANAVYRGFDATPQQKGSTIQINRPTTFVAAAMPVAASPLNPNVVTITLNQWSGVTFQLTDKELAYTKEKIIADHINPAAFAVADAIDQTLCALYTNVPWQFTASATFALTDLTAVRKIMFNNKVPLADRHVMVNGEREAGMLNLDTFNIVSRSSDGAATQRDGYLGNKFGFEIFANQNVQASTAGAAVVTTGSLATSGASAQGATQLTLAATAVTGTIKAGDIIQLAGQTQQYAVSANATFAGNAITVQIQPPLVAADAGGTAVTLLQNSKNENLAFHRNAFALAMAPLSELGDGLGARIATAQDPITGLTLRSRVFYDGTNAQLNVSIDALWGVQTLDPNLAVRYQS